MEEKLVTPQEKGKFNNSRIDEISHIVVDDEEEENHTLATNGSKPNLSSNASKRIVQIISFFYL